MAFGPSWRSEFGTGGNGASSLATLRRGHGHLFDVLIASVVEVGLEGTGEVTSGGGCPSSCQQAGFGQREVGDLALARREERPMTVPSITVVLLAVSLSLTAGCSSPQASSIRKHSSSETTSPSTFVSPSTSPLTKRHPLHRPLWRRNVASPPSYGSVSGRRSRTHGTAFVTSDPDQPRIRALRLSGYPGVAFYDARDVLLPLSYQRHGDQVVTAPVPEQVGVASGNAVFVMINKYRCDLGDKATAATLRLIPPDDTTSMTLSIQGLRDLSYCGPGDPGSTLEISPVEPTASATAAH